MIPIVSTTRVGHIFFPSSCDVTHINANDNEVTVYGPLIGSHWSCSKVPHSQGNFHRDGIGDYLFQQHLCSSRLDVQRANVHRSVDQSQTWPSSMRGWRKMQQQTLFCCNITSVRWAELRGRASRALLSRSKFYTCISGGRGEHILCPLLLRFISVLQDPAAWAFISVGTLRSTVATAPYTLGVRRLHWGWSSVEPVKRSIHHWSLADTPAPLHHISRFTASVEITFLCFSLKNSVNFIDLNPTIGTAAARTTYLTLPPSHEILSWIFTESIFPQAYRNRLLEEVGCAGTPTSFLHPSFFFFFLWCTFLFYVFASSVLKLLLYCLLFCFRHLIQSLWC